MKIDFYEKVFLGLTIVALVGFMGAIAYAASRHGITVPHPVGRVDPATLRSAPPPPFDRLGVVETGPGTYDVNLLAAMWQFEPYVDKANDPIRVPAGATVTFNLSSPDLVHGFKITGTDVNVMVIPGQVSQVAHTFDAPGEYLAVCHEYCGLGHQLMYARIVVVDAAAAVPGAPAAVGYGEGGS